MKHLSILKKALVVAGFFLFFIAEGIIIWFLAGNRRDSDQSQSIEALIAEAKEYKPEEVYATSHKEEPEELPEENAPMEETYATSHKEETEDVRSPLTEAPVRPMDMYARKDSTPVFKSFYPEAERYIWEIYDIAENGWKEAPSEMVTMELDELYRMVSAFRIPESCHHNGELVVRCTVDLKEKESITDVATLHILEKNIADIVIEDLKTDAGYVSAQTVPVTVEYSDGSKETLTNLSGLCFLDKQESFEEQTTVSGNSLETITTVIKGCDYFCLGMEEENLVMRYQAADMKKDIPVKITGEDLEAPVIKKLDISDFTISSEDVPVPVTVTIHAEDNSTPYPKLLYAFLPEGEEPGDETNWYTTPSFEVSITRNGKWYAYCKDLGGNIAFEERDIIAVDNKAPVVSLSLESEEWCKTNKILVRAKDGLSVEYCYSCAETGETSGWIAQNEYEVRQNSTWEVKVRDAVGNVTEQDITIDNIDNQMPVIRNISISEKEIEKGEHKSNEEKN